MENQVATQSQVAVIAGMAEPTPTQIAKSKARLEFLLNEYGHMVGNRQRNVTGRNYFSKEDLPLYDDKMIVYLCEEVDEHEKFMLSAESLRCDIM